jgi:N-[(2S)-2-amino-2-carboxyethyl]-L-glutamate dehydrogenase
MRGDGVLILGGDEISSLLHDREGEVLDSVRRAYLAHGRGQSSLPHSSFLRFPGDETNRIISLPAYLGEDGELAGLKWISSFPANVRKGMARASAVLLLNSCATGRVEAILESSLISAKRTAASAALAARELLGGSVPKTLGLVGTGVINFETVRFLRAVLPEVSEAMLFDLDTERAARFAGRLREMAEGFEVKLATSVEEVLRRCALVSFATTAIRPHVADLSICRPGAVILHISLRDLAPEAILACDNVVDDPDHVCRAQTSVHLAEQLTGSRDFIRCTLADILEGNESARRDDRSVTVFSPFGLGILDLAVGRLAHVAAIRETRGAFIDSFFPTQEETL